MYPRESHKERRIGGQPGVTGAPSLQPMAADAFHPDLRRVARWLPRAAVGPRTLMPLRTATGLLARTRKKDVAVHSVGPISVRVHQPVSSAQPLPALLWIHGGGYVIGTAAQDDALCRYFAQTLGIGRASCRERVCWIV